MNLKRNVLPIPGGLKAVYNFTDGTFLGEIVCITVGPTGPQNLPALLLDFANALNDAAKAAKEANDAKIAKANEGMAATAVSLDAQSEPESNSGP
jgi:hypothetical protein